MNKTLKSQAIHGLSWSLADKLINQLGSLAVTIYLARLIGPESFGFIGMLMIFFLFQVSSLGLQIKLKIADKDIVRNTNDSMYSKDGV